MGRRFDGKVAVIAGGASGIGLAIARRLVAEGGRAVLGDVNRSALQGAVSEFGAQVRPATVDVRVEAQVAAMTEAALAQFGRLDLGFNCAGLGIFGELVELEEAQWDTVLDICLKGVWLCVKHEARAMAAHGGAIVNVASLNSQIPMYGGGAYSCAKAGVEMLSRNAALELAPRAIRVNTVSPGLTETPLTTGVRADPQLEAAYLQRIPMARAASPDEIAAAALFLASDDAAYVSGSNLIVDGGWQTTGYPDLRPFAGGIKAARAAR